jgi:hypothetical protein
MSVTRADGSYGQKKNEARLPEEKQHEVLLLRGKHTPLHEVHLMSTDARQLRDKLSDPHVFAAFEALNNNDNTKCFLSLYKAAADGHLNDEKTFHELCSVFNDQLKRKHSEDKNKKFGQRYPTNYLNFMLLMRSRGGSTARQYGILTGQVGGVSPRHLRYVHVFLTYSFQYCLQIFKATCCEIRRCFIKSVSNLRECRSCQKTS